MKTRFLIPHQFKALGWFLFIPAIFLGAWQFLSGFEPEWLDWRVPSLFSSKWSFDEGESSWVLVRMIENNVADEICASLFLIGGLLLVFAKEYDEDEMIAKIRMESMLWSARVNGVLLLLCVMLVYDFTFFYVMVFNLFLLLLLFIVRFNLLLYKFRRVAE